MEYEKLHEEARLEGITVYEKPVPGELKGLYYNDAILIRKDLETSSEKCCIMAEELGHHFTTVGDITDQRTIKNRKQELKARRWSYEKLLPLSRLVEIVEMRPTNRFEAAELAGVTEEFLDAAIQSYVVQYGELAEVNNHTFLRFYPLGIIRLFE